MTTCGGFAGEIDLGRLAERLDQLFVDDLDDRLRGRKRAHDLFADRALAHAGEKLFDDFEINIRLQEREADLTKRRVDIGFRQLAFAAELFENRVELLGQTVEHSGGYFNAGRRITFTIHIMVVFARSKHPKVQISVLSHHFVFMPK